MKTTDSSISPDGSAWRPKKLSTREERRRAERDARKQAHQADETEGAAPPAEAAQDEPLEP
jgi:hypothetical protein